MLWNLEGSAAEVGKGEEHITDDDIQWNYTGPQPVWSQNTLERSRRGYLGHKHTLSCRTALAQR